MTSENRAGRPRASSRETLSEAACELFLEQGYESTTVADISRRAGVSRSSFFNYFTSKAAVLWAGLDHRIDAFEQALRHGATTDADDRDPAARITDGLEKAVLEMAVDFTPDALALAMVNAAAMGVEGELARDSALRSARIARAVSAQLAGAGADPLEAEVRGAAWGGAVLAAIASWARAGAGRAALSDHLARAVTLVRSL